LKIYKTHELTPATLPLSETDKLWLYNGLDACVTAEVRDVLIPQLDKLSADTYWFERDLQGPILDMRLRGVRVDLKRREEVLSEYESRVRRVSATLDEIIASGITDGESINWRSPQQLSRLLYEILRLPSVVRHGRVTVNRNALEKLQEHFFAQPIIAHILFLRDLAKKIDVLKTEVDPDGRVRTSYNIAGTTTGRLSSSLSDFGTGGNLQNIEELLREIFISDPGMKFAYIDLEQAESRLVGAIEWNLFHDGTYLDACESGDLHTTVCRLAWGDKLKWTGNIKADRDLAEQPFYRQHSYRHMAKVLGHGTNYNGQPFTMAAHTKLEQKYISDFQLVYFRAFPAHKRWHAAVEETLRRDGFLVSLSGRRRWFFGRRDDGSTIREAIAYDPQGSVGDILNRGMLQVWRTRQVQVLLQVHDAILIQYPEEKEDEIVPAMCKSILFPVPLSHGRTLVIPAEAKTGWNWGAFHAKNLDGLKKFTGHDDRQRVSNPETSILDRRLR
jgi:DNA polymerase I